MKKSLLIFCFLLSISWLSAQNIHISLLKDVGSHYPVDTLNIYTETLDHKPLPYLKSKEFKLWLKQKQV